MARTLLTPDPENASIDELKQLSRTGSSETATRCAAIQILLVGASRELVCDAMLVTNRALRKGGSTALLQQLPRTLRAIGFTHQ